MTVVNAASRFNSTRRHGWQITRDRIRLAIDKIAEQRGGSLIGMRTYDVENAVYGLDSSLRAVVEVGGFSAMIANAHREWLSSNEAWSKA